MKRLLVAFTLIVFIFISFFVYGQFLNRQKDVAAQGEEETPVIAATDKISAEAQIVPHYFTTLSSIVGGQVSILLVEEGEAVRADDPLLRLDAPEMENALRQVETAVTQAEATVAEAEANLAVAQAQLESARAGVDVAEVGVTAAQAQQDLQDAQPEAAEEDIAAAYDRIAAVNVEQAEAAVAQAETGVSQAEANVTRAEFALVRARAALDQAEVAQEAAEAALAQLTLNAWSDGEIADILVKPGTVVSPGTPVIVLADFSEWLVETTDLTELDVVDMIVGMTVEVKIDALPDETLAGTIIGIDRVSSLTRGDVTYVVTVRLDETAEDLPLRWGMTAFVNIDIE